MGVRWKLYWISSILFASGECKVVSPCRAGRLKKRCRCWTRNSHAAGKADVIRSRIWSPVPMARGMKLNKAVRVHICGIGLRRDGVYSFHGDRVCALFNPRNFFQSRCCLVDWIEGLRLCWDGNGAPDGGWGATSRETPDVGQIRRCVAMSPSI